MQKNIFTYFLVCKGLPNDGAEVGGKGRRISGGTPGGRSQNRRFRSRNVGGGYRRTTRLHSLTPLQLETRFWGQNYLDLV